jgi:hypothetical protein
VCPKSNDLEIVKQQKHFAGHQSEAYLSVRHCCGLDLVCPVLLIEWRSSI